MKKSVLAVGVSAFVLAIGSAATPATAAPAHHQSGAGGLVFVQNDDPAGNRVFVYHRAEASPSAPLPAVCCTAAP